MPSCILCGDGVMSDAAYFHEVCSDEYWRRAKAGICVRCGSEERRNGLVCARCDNDESRYCGYRNGEC